MTDETRTRFLAAIAAQLPPERVIELHLFGGIRQGGMESGVAVIAVEPPSTSAAEVDDNIDIETAAELEAIEEEAATDVDDESPYAAADVDAGDGDEGDDAVTADEPMATTGAPSAARPAPRYVVYTARYRHTLKGLDRGKWEVSVTEEADAPLVTVDAVVRGVSRRSGDGDETVRLSGDEFRAALPEPATRP